MTLKSLCSVQNVIIYNCCKITTLTDRKSSRKEHLCISPSARTKQRPALFVPAAQKSQVLKSSVKILALQKEFFKSVSRILIWVVYFPQDMQFIYQSKCRQRACVHAVVLGVDFAYFFLMGRMNSNCKSLPL